MIAALLIACYHDRPLIIEYTSGQSSTGGHGMKPDKKHCTAGQIKYVSVEPDYLL